MLDGEEYLVLLSAYQEWLPGGSLQCGNGEESKGTKPNRGNSWRQDTQWNLPPEQKETACRLESQFRQCTKSAG